MLRHRNATTPAAASSEDDADLSAVDPDVAESLPLFDASLNDDNQHAERESQSCTTLCEKWSKICTFCVRLHPRSRRNTAFFFLLLTLWALGNFEVRPTRFVVTLARTIIFPLLRRPHCLPRGQMPRKNVTFALTELYLPRDGPNYWKASEREMIALSEANKMAYCHGRDNESKRRFNNQQSNGNHGGARCTYINGTSWAEENYSNGTHLDKIKGSRRGFWFKPTYLRELLQNANADIDQDIDWILYMDSDTMIVNQNFDLRQLLAGARPDDALIISPEAEYKVNSGVFLLRNDVLGKMILEAWAAADSDAMARMTDQDYLALMFDDDSGQLLERYMPKESIDNSNSRRPRMKIIRQCALQSGGGIEQAKGSFWPYFEGTFVRGDFTVHFFGRPNKLEQMKLASRGSIGFFS